MGSRDSTKHLGVAGGSLLPGSRLGLSAILLLALVRLPYAAASLPLKVLARTRIELDVRGDASRVVALARLVDDLGRGIPARELELRAGDQSKRGLSNEEGRLGPWTLRLPRGSTRFTARFAGDAWGFQRSAAELFFEVRLPEPRLRVDHASRLGPDAPLTLRVLAELHGRPLADLELTAEVDRVPRGGVRRSDPFGRAVWQLRPEDLGGHGLHRVRVSSGSTRELAAAEARGKFWRVLPTELSLLARNVHGILQDQVEVSGRLVAEGHGVGAQWLQITLGDRQERVISRQDGGFALRVLVAELQPGTLEVEAVFSGTGGLEPSAASTDLRLPKVEPPSLLYHGVVAATTFLLLLVLAAWQRLRAWLGRSRYRRELPEAREPRAPSPLPAWTMLPAEPSAALPDPLVLHGVLWDRIEDRPLPLGTLELRPRRGEAAVARTRSGEHGAFRIQAPRAGTWWIEARAPGYLRHSQQLRLPVRGRSRQVVRLGLMPVREMVRLIYLDAAGRGANDRRPLWGWETPAQVLHATRSCSAAFEALTHLLERVYYSAGPQIEERCARARALASAAGTPQPSEGTDG